MIHTRPASWLPRVPHFIALTLLTMNPHPTGGSSLIFQDGKLKPGIYKIQNVLTETYVDIEISSRIVCSRPAQNLGEGRGLVRLFLWPVVRVSNDPKWEIKPFGAGYSVQRVSASIWTDMIFPLCTECKA